MIIEENIELIQNCMICSQEGGHHYFGLKDYFFDTSGSWESRSCNRCKHVWLSKRLPKNKIRNAYINYYTHQSKDRMIKNKLVNNLFMKLYGADIFRQFHDTSKRVLDVGCGNGDYLNSLKKRGIEYCVGIDFDKNAVEYCISKGLNVKCQTVEELALSNEKFDIIVINHVVEHIYDFREFLNAVRKLLNKDGYICIRTPNNNSVSQVIFGKFWRGLEPPRHINLFSRKSLYAVISEFDFINIKNYTHNDYRLVRNSLISSFDAIMKSRGFNFELKNSRLRYITILIALSFKLLDIILKDNGEELIFVGRLK